jgi:hypothetical protein
MASQPSGALMYLAAAAVAASVAMVAIGMSNNNPRIGLPREILSHEESLERCASNGLELRPSTLGPGTGRGVFATQPYKFGQVVCYYDGDDMETSNGDSSMEYALTNPSGGHRAGYAEARHPCGVGQLANDNGMVDLKDRRSMTLKGVNSSILAYVKRSAEAVTLVWLQDTKNPFLLYATRDIEAGEELWASCEFARPRTLVTSNPGRLEHTPFLLTADPLCSDGPMYWMGNLHEESKYPTPMAKLLGCMITAYWTDYSPRAQTEADRVAALAQRSCATLTVGEETGGLSVHRLEYDPTSRAIRRRQSAQSLEPLNDGAASAFLLHFMRVAEDSPLWAKLDEKNPPVASGATPAAPTAGLSPKGKVRRAVAYLLKGHITPDHDFEIFETDPYAGEGEGEEHDQGELAEGEAAADAPARPKPTAAKRKKRRKSRKTQ